MSNHCRTAILLNHPLLTIDICMQTADLVLIAGVLLRTAAAP